MRILAPHSATMFAHRLNRSTTLERSLLLSKAIEYVFSLRLFSLLKENIIMLKFMVINSPSDIFSPASGGSVKASSAIDEISTQGMIRLKP